MLRSYVVKLKSFVVMLRSYVVILRGYEGREWANGISNNVHDIRNKWNGLSKKTCIVEIKSIFQLLHQCIFFTKLYVMALCNAHFGSIGRKILPQMAIFMGNCCDLIKKINFKTCFPFREWNFIKFTWLFS